MKKLEDYKIMPIFPQESVSDPQISPDGSRVIYTYTTVNMDEDKYDSHIWMCHLGGKNPSQFTRGKCDDNHPRWSPDGKYILFLSNRMGENEKGNEEKRKKQIWVIPAEGGEARRLTFIKEGAQRPVWSPDGKNVAFVSNIFKGEKVKGSDVKIIKRIRYKGDGKGFFEGKWTQLFSIPAKGGRRRTLTNGEFDVEAFSWSPKCDKIAFVSNLDYESDFSFFKNIYTLSAKGGEPQLLWKGFGEVGALSWSPDGRNLAFTGRVIDNPKMVWHKNTYLWIIPSKGGRPINLTSSLDRTLRSAKEVKWSPDSKHIYFLVPDKGCTHIYRTNLNGESERLTEGLINVYSFSLNDSGSILAFNSTDASTPTELWTMENNCVRKRTNMNKNLLKKLRLSEPEEFWFTASDGCKIQGWIVRPWDFDPKKKYPTVIQIHGGPRSAYGFKLTAAEHEFQVLADHGYVVVYTNPRASIGYGEDFAGLISGHWGERDYLDIIEAADYIVDNYFLWMKTGLA